MRLNQFYTLQCRTQKQKAIKNSVFERHHHLDLVGFSVIIKLIPIQAKLENSGKYEDTLPILQPPDGCPVIDQWRPELHLPEKRRRHPSSLQTHQVSAQRFVCFHTDRRGRLGGSVSEVPVVRECLSLSATCLFIVGLCSFLIPRSAALQNHLGSPVV